jgi:deoxyribodipyrimidine photo-lyase
MSAETGFSYQNFMAKQPIVVVWFKRDFRLKDHAPLQEAIRTDLPILLVTLEEPSLTKHPAMDERHFRFVRESVADINFILRPYSCTLHHLHMEAEDFFVRLSEHCQIKGIFSHEETGLRHTFERDKRIRLWCNKQQIIWTESPSNGVIRGLKSRENWAKDWLNTMQVPPVDPNLNILRGITLPNSFHALQVETLADTTGCERQVGGPSHAELLLHDFLHKRARGYMKAISKPEASRKHCSRLSPYLAWGNLSIRQVYQALQAALPLSGFKRDLSAFKSRLYWHCHFIQKFESECRMEWENHNRAFDHIRKEVYPSYVQAWEEGKTGYPLVDACMRCVRQTGYINFRMRALLISFLTHHLWQPWQAGAAFLARQFLDFEPGIHYPQIQMQAGTVGTHIFRVYNPQIQAEKHDPDAAFVQRWVPELQSLPSQLARQPWEITPIEELMYQFKYGKDYPTRIVDITITGPRAQKKLFELSRSPMAQQEAAKILLKHSNPNRTTFANGEMEDADENQSD